MTLDKHFTDDSGLAIEGARTGADYAEYRPDYPEQFYRQLAEGGVDLAQRTPGFGTGVGSLNQRLALQCAEVTATDVAAGQIKAARGRAQEVGLSVDHRVAPAEAMGMPPGHFDAVMASRCSHARSASTSPCYTVSIAAYRGPCKRPRVGGDVGVPRRGQRLSWCPSLWG